MIFLWISVILLAFWVAVLAAKLHGLLLRYGTVLSWIEAIRQGKIENVELPDLGFGVGTEWLDVFGNEQRFEMAAKENCSIRFDDGTECRYNDEHPPRAILTKFKVSGCGVTKR